MYLVLTCGAQQNSLHLGSEIGGIKVGRPRGRAEQDTLDYLLTWDQKCPQLMFTWKNNTFTIVYCDVTV